MATTMTLIAKQTVGASGASSITFSNIPQTYTDLKVVMSARSTVSGATDGVSLSINGSNSNLSGKYTFWNGNSGGTLNGGTAIGTQEAGWINGSTSTSSSFSNVELYFPNYTVSTTSKPYSIDSVHENNAATGTNSLYIGIWANVWNPATKAAISSLTFTPSGSFVEYSTIYLYGISNNTTTQNTTVPYATGGDVITTDGTYWYHAFKTSGSFTPLKDITADILVVAGGGGGGGGLGTNSNGGGGGGAGGFRTFTAQTLTSSINYTCSIGAGGNGGSTSIGVGSNGVNSSFSGSGFTTINTSGGGGGGSEGVSNNGAGGRGSNGGSGGGNVQGGAGSTSGSGNTGGYTPVEGYAGGYHSGGFYATGAGGGGAGGLGGNVTSTYVPASGGIGAYSTLTDAIGAATATGQLSSGHYYYAGGGGGGCYDQGSGGAGGLGGGGNGADSRSNNGSAATANTGGGGGGSANASPGGAKSGGNGGSGIIVLRYAV